jgi:FkbM family methyltransferase
MEAEALFVSLAITRASLVALQSWMGHADVKATMRYLHQQVERGRGRTARRGLRARGSSGRHRGGWRTIGSMLARGVKAIARRFGVEVGRYRSVEARRVGRGHDRKIDLVLDVGANRGQYGLSLRAFGYTEKIVSFEPLAKPFAELLGRASNDPLWECHQTALGDASGEATMNIASNIASSSFLPMLDAHKAARPSVTYVGVERVAVRRLDSFDFPAGARILLKVDAQGFEAQVFTGTDDLWPLIRIVECELSLAPLYDGQPSFRTVIDYLGDRGFSIVDLDPFFYDPSDGRVLSIDAFFCKST